jgi:hypothetical protein
MQTDSRSVAMPLADVLDKAARKATVSKLLTNT